MIINPKAGTENTLHSDFYFHFIRGEYVDLVDLSNGQQVKL